MFIDTHAHLNDARLIDDVPRIINDANNSLVDVIICASYDAKSSVAAYELSKKYSNVYATVGFHPYDAMYYTEDTEKDFIELAKNRKVIAIGEIGLDYHIDTSPVDVQKDVFKKQIILADKLGLPIVIHMRDATGDTMEILRECKSYINHGGIMHCFNGSIETMNEVFKLGLLVSFGGAITFKNAKNFEELIKKAPLDKFVLETDCPYLTPVPYRGQTNEPKYVVCVAEKIAEVLNMSAEEVGKFTTNNVKRLFNI